MWNMPSYGHTSMYSHVVFYLLFNIAFFLAQSKLLAGCVKIEV